MHTGHLVAVVASRDGAVVHGCLVDGEESGRKEGGKQGGIGRNLASSTVTVVKNALAPMVPYIFPHMGLHESVSILKGSSPLAWEGARGRTPIR